MKKRVNRTNQRVNPEIVGGKVLRLEAGRGRLEVFGVQRGIDVYIFDSKNMSNEA
ncbi:hypothetical protein WH221_06335 [Chryseobacterium culicis]|uniref:hypothetical protein n=1 Tax=Chryseobacterium culicis TaxID=680127 RepID=UPI0013FDF421|nr:hypothetical protein [Chryseobacterium culicis]